LTKTILSFKKAQKEKKKKENCKLKFIKTLKRKKKERIAKLKFIKTGGKKDGFWRHES
jgi:hypothetical protein